MAISGAVSRSWLFAVLACFLLTFAQAFYFELLERERERCFIEEYDDNEATIRGSYKVIQYNKGNRHDRPGSVLIKVLNPDKLEILSREYKKEGTFAYMTSKSGAYELCFYRIPASDQVTRVYLHYEEKTKAEPEEPEDQAGEEREQEDREQEERERKSDKSKNKEGESQDKEDESEHDKDKTKTGKEEEEQAADEAREKKGESQHDEAESEHDKKERLKAEKEEEEREQAADEARDKEGKHREDPERRGKKRPIALRILSAADDKYSVVWQMYLRYKKREKVFRNLSKTTNRRVLWWGFFQIVVLAATAAWQMRHLTKFFILKKIV